MAVSKVTDKIIYLIQVPINPTQGLLDCLFKFRPFPCTLHWGFNNDLNVINISKAFLTKKWS